MLDVTKLMSQPFAVAEQFTGIPGKYVKLEDTISSFERVVDGEFDNLPEQAFYMDPSPRRRCRVRDGELWIEHFIFLYARATEQRRISEHRIEVESASRAIAP